MIFNKLLETRATKYTGGDPQNPSYWVQKLFGGGTTTNASVDVTEDAVLGLSAFFCGVNLIANAIKRLPWKVMEREAGGMKTEAASHPAYRLLARRPNPETTPSRFKWWLVMCMILWGKGLAEIERDGSGEPVNLWPIHPSRARLFRNENGQLVWEVRNEDNSVVHIPDRDMLHVFVFSRDGVDGQSVLQVGYESIGVCIAQERAAANLFAGGMLGPGIIKFAQKMDDTAMQRFRKRWKEIYGGAAGETTVLLKPGVEYEPIGIPPEDAQLIESRVFGVTDAARWLNLPPHKLKELTHATFSNIEEQNIEVVGDAYLPYTIEMEEAADLKLVGDQMVDAFYTKMNVRGLLRGNMETQANYYRERVSNGLSSINDILRLEDENPIGPIGDKRWMQAQMVPIDILAEGPKEPDPEPQGSGDTTDNDEEDEERSLTLESLRPVFRDAAGRIVHKEIDRVRRAMTKHSGDVVAFRSWLDDFYGKHEAFVAQTIEPLQQLIEEPQEIRGEWKRNCTTKMAVGPKIQLYEDCRSDNWLVAVGERLDEWQEKRADEFADWSVSHGTGH